MDSYSGKFPLDLISLYLDMKSRDLSDPDPAQIANCPRERLTASGGTQGPSRLTVPSTSMTNSTEQALTPTSASSGSAAESLSAYAERTTVEAILARGGHGIAPSNPGETELAEKMVGAAPKSSESLGIAINTMTAPTISHPSQDEKVPSASKRHEGNENETVPAAKDILDPTEHFTDINEVKDLMDSSGVGGPSFRWIRQYPL